MSSVPVFFPEVYDELAVLLPVGAAQVRTDPPDSYRFPGVLRYASYLQDYLESALQVRTLPATVGSTESEELENQTVEKVELHPNFPNPFSGTTTISFQLPEEMPVVVAIYNIVGQRVTELLDETRGAGPNQVEWVAGDIPSGVYIIRLQTPQAVRTRTVTLVR